jgi:hypothetical protein
MLARTLVKRRQFAVVAAVATIVVLSSLFLILPSLSSTPPPPPSLSPQVTITTKQSSNPPPPQIAPWAFQGAYANYSGTAFLQNHVPLNLNFSMRVLAVHGTDAKILTVIREATPFKTATAMRDIRWFRATTGFLQEGLGACLGKDAAGYHYASSVTVMGSTIPVAVYTYGNDSSSLSVSFSRQIGFPVQLVFSFGGNFLPITVPLVKTNIPGLVP